MAETQTNWIDFWISLTDLAQTGFWVCAAAALIIYFREPLFKIVDSIGKRVERGDNITIGSSVTIEAVKASASLEADIENEVREQISEYLAASDSEEAEALSDRVVSAIRKKSFLTVDFEGVGTNDKQSIPYNQFESIGLLLRYIWLEASCFPPHSYGKKWIIKNERTGEFLEEIGSRYSRSNLGTRWDYRDLSSVDILVGDTISVHWK